MPRITTPCARILATTCLVFLVVPLASAQFAPAVVLPVGAGPDSVASGDWDGDGDVDLAVPVGAPDRVVFLVNDGQGGFVENGSLSTGNGTAPHGVAAGDLDADGDVDVAVSLPVGNAVRVLLNAAGVFSLGSLTPTGLQPRNLRAGALVGEAVDLVSVNREGDSLTLLLNKGNASFATVTLPTGDEPRDVAIADLNGDGDADLAATSRGASRVDLFAHDGMGGFTVATPLAIGGQLKLDGLVAASFNADGTLDLAVAGSGGGDQLVVRFVNVGEGEGAGVYAGPVACSVGGLQPTGITALDAELDGDMDLLTADSASDGLSLIPGNGFGSFNAPVVLGAADQPAFVATADFDGNGGPDIVAAAVAYGGVVLLRNLSGANVFTDLGSGLAGTHGVPQLEVSSSLCAGATLSMELSSAAHYAFSVLVVGLDAAPLPFKGGTLVPVPDVLMPFFTSDEGYYLLSGTLPALPPGLNLYIQAVVQDEAGPQQIALSNAMHGCTPYLQTDA